MNYNTIAFAPTAAAKRSIKGHALNTRTYGLIAAVVVLTGIKAAFDFAADRHDSREIRRLELQLLDVRAKRHAVRQVIKVVQSVEQNPVAAKVGKVWNRKGDIARQVGDKVFSLN